MVLKSGSVVTLSWSGVGSRGQVFHTLLLVCSVTLNVFCKLLGIQGTSLKFLLHSDCFTEQHLALFSFIGLP